MINILWVATGGAFGASLRFLTSNFLKYLFPNFPLGTFFVNIIGSFMIGILMSYLQNKYLSENFIKYFLIIGALGSFTTFSTFFYEVIDLFNNKKVFTSLFYVIISLTTCLMFAYLGYNLNKP